MKRIGIVKFHHWQGEKAQGASVEKHQCPCGLYTVEVVRGHSRASAGRRTAGGWRTWR